MQIFKLSAELSSEAIGIVASEVEKRLEVPLRAADIAATTGLPLETTREALVSLALRNRATITEIGADTAYIFKKATPSGRRRLGPKVRVALSYVADLFTSQLSYLIGLGILIGPAFVGARMVELGLEGDLFYLIGGGTLCFAAVALILKLVVRSISVVLPPLVLAGIALGWERWTAEDLYWIPLAVLVAIGLQIEVLRNYRKLRPQDPVALFLWGRAFTSPVSELKRVVDLIRAQNGVITTADLVRVFGWSLDHASEQLSEVIAEYGGDVAVDEDGHLHVWFEELSRAEEKAEVPEAAWARETSPPGPFEGLDLRWVSAASVACWLGIVASPFNPAYINFVADLDFTLSGIPFILRFIFAGFCAFPLMLYFGRIVLNLIERDDFKKRRRFLEQLEYATKHASGSFVGLDKFTNQELVEFGAEIDHEKGVQGSIWVSFPELTRRGGLRPPQMNAAWFEQNQVLENPTEERQTEVAEAHART
ncbi:hypothetical protein FRD01_10365 [Microvenator marinus]|uniref:Uncharacterized protein n=1 Tax=Microvenator marinus TaxID=2600177 RepID=A0A5B8XV75_9DELT|nr:hypothetical protein [Microvenator marinus]QED27636.1 hypothetical protein FRD01_10365 [Microvenator marinus]